MEDYHQIPFYRMYPAMGSNINNAYLPRGPYSGQNVYMDPVQYQAEADYERDLERLKQMYPDTVKSLASYVEEACEKMEYEGSLMYDEYPDQRMVRKMAEKIYQDIITKQEENQSVSSQGRGNRKDVEDMILVLLYNEMYKRRCRRRRCRRWW